MKIVLIVILINSVWGRTRDIKSKVLVRDEDLDTVEKVDGVEVTYLKNKISIETKKCTADAYVYKDCNLCKCNALGTEERCTLNDCFALNQVGTKGIKRRIYEDLGATGSCKPNTWYAMQPCRFCYCQKASKLVCSTRSSDAKPITVGLYNLTDCGQELVKELYDLGTTFDPVSRSKLAARTTVDAPGHIIAASPAQAIPYSLKQEDEPKLATNKEDWNKEDWTEDLPRTPVDYKPAWKLEQPLPWSMNKIKNPFTQEDTEISTSLDNKVNTPPESSMQLQDRHLRLKEHYNSEDEEDESRGSSAQHSTRISKPVENEPAQSPSKQQYSSAENESEEKSSLSPSEQKEEDAKHLQVAKNEIMASLGMPKEMTDMLSSLRQETQTPAWEQESKVIESVMGERQFSIALDTRDVNNLQMELPSSLERIIQLALRKSMVKIDSSQTCTPGDTTKDGCNYCYCLNNGKMLCTVKETC